jgi:truncated hemoglobin YjbI
MRKARAADNADQQKRAKQSVELFSRAVRELTENGANTKEIARTLRMIADELEGGA